MIDADRLQSWEREAIAQLARHYGTTDERGDLAGRIIALVFEIKDLSRHRELAG